MYELNEQPKRFSDINRLEVGFWVQSPGGILEIRCPTCSLKGAIMSITAPLPP